MSAAASSIFARRRLARELQRLVDADAMPVTRAEMQAIERSPGVVAADRAANPDPPSRSVVGGSVPSAGGSARGRVNGVHPCMATLHTRTRRAC
jgi:hypothetical protein